MGHHQLRVFSLIVLFLALMCQSQKYCQNCWKDNKFQCNGQGCQIFDLDPSQPGYACAGYYTYNGIFCYKYESSSSCYYNSAPGKCTACNYTYPNCHQCTVQKGCRSCDTGYYLYTYNLQTGQQNCKQCSVSIAGCEICESQYKCNQCKSQYRIMNGLCYNQDGSLVNGDSDGSSIPNKEDTLYSLVIVLFVLVGVILVLLGVGAFFVCKKVLPLSKKSLLTESKEDY